jgi:hypothetical protein
MTGGFMRLWCSPMALLVFFGLAANAAAGQAALSRADLARAGIAVATLHTVRMPRSIPALGVVLNPAPLLRLRGSIAQAEARLSGAAAKLQLEQQQADRARLLYRQAHNISAADLQKAEEELAAAQAALAAAAAERAALLAQASASWGKTIATALRDGSDPLPQLAAGTAILIGLGLPPGTSLADPPQQVEAEAAGIRFPLRLIGPIPGMVGGYPGEAFLYEAAPVPGVPVGSTVSARLPAGPVRTGVLVPFSAVLWQGSHAIVFRAAAEGRFEPVPIATDVPTDSGYLVSESLSRGNRVVVRGAALLLRGPSQPRGEEDEDAD